MTKKERLLLAMRGGCPDRIPVAPFTGRCTLSASPVPWKALLSDPAVCAEREIDRLLAFDYDAVWCPSIDVFSPALGAELTIQDAEGPIVVGRTIASKKDLDEVVARAADLPDGRWVRFMLAVCRELRHRAGRDTPVITFGPNPFRLACALVGLTPAFEMITDDPPFLHAILEVCTEIAIASNRILAAGEADVIWTAQPTASANCISRRHYEQFAHPYNRRLNAALEPIEIPFVVHTCGRWEDRFDLVLEEGRTPLHVDDTDLPALRGLAGQTAPLMGQVPTDLMLNGTSRQVARRAAKDMREGGAQGGFVLAATCGLPPYTPAENIHALVAAAAGHGRQPPESNP